MRYAERLYRTEAAGREKHLQFTAVRLPCWVCMYSINPFTVGKYYTVNTRGNRETNMLNIHITDFRPVANKELWLPSSLSHSSFFLVLSFFLSLHVSLPMYDMSKSYFHVLAPLILMANTGRYVLMIVSSGHLSSVRLLSSEEVNTPSELWLF